MTIQDKFDSIDSKRLSWPFKDMAVGDVVVFSDERKSMAASTAHGYGRSCGMKFKTRKDPETGDVYIKRMA